MYTIYENFQAVSDKVQILITHHVKLLVTPWERFYRKHNRVHDDNNKNNTDSPPMNLGIFWSLQGGKRASAFRVANNKIQTESLSHYEIPVLVHGWYLFRGKWCSWHHNAHTRVNSWIQFGTKTLYVVSSSEVHSIKWYSCYSLVLKGSTVICSLFLAGWSTTCVIYVSKPQSRLSFIYTTQHSTKVKEPTNGK